MKYFYPNKTPDALAIIHGNAINPMLEGTVSFYNTPNDGVIIQVEVFHLHDNPSGFFGMHIHQYGNCDIPFDKTGNHFSKTETYHPNHTGDLPPLLSDNGYAWMVFYDSRFVSSDVIGKSIIIHSKRDDFTSQPSGDSGEKIGCGIISAVNCRPLY